MDMCIHVLNMIPVNLTMEEAVKRLHINEDLEEEFSDIFQSCMRIACPKGMFTCRPAAVEEDLTRVGDVEFSSRVMRKNFEKCAYVYPSVATCGRELYDFAQSRTDPLERYWADTISEMLLGKAVAFVRMKIAETYGTRPLRQMNPGSLSDFPIERQRELFALLDDRCDEIGLVLKPSFLMIPEKSSSAIHFESEEDYENCALCLRNGCPNRRAAFDKELYCGKFGLQG